MTGRVDETPPPDNEPPGAPLSRLVAFEKELLEVADRHMAEGGLDLTQMIGTLEWVKWRAIQHLSRLANEAGDEGA